MKNTLENFSFNWRSYTFTHSVALTQHAGFPCFQCTNSKKPRASFFQLLRCNNVTSENCINELISGRILALWSLFLDAKCIEIFRPHKERITILVAIGKNQLQKGLSLNLSKTFFVPISRYSTFILFSFFFYHNRNGRTRKTLNGKTALKDLTAQRTLS